MKSNQIDVLTVGAGPVGLVAALKLAKAGVNVRIIDRDDRAGTHSYALALHSRTQELLRELGVGQALWDNGCRVDNVQFRDSRGNSATLNISGKAGKDGLLVVGQDHLEVELERACERCGTQVMWNHRLSNVHIDADKVDVELEELSEGLSGYASAHLEWQVSGVKNVQAPYLIGADGFMSYLRHNMKIDFPKVGPTQSFAVFEFKTDVDFHNTANVHFSDEGSNILWPLPGGYCRWAFQVNSLEGAISSRNKDRLFAQFGSQGYPHLEAGQLNEFIKQRVPWFKGSIGPLRWCMIVRFEQRLVSRYGTDRIWLAGDAAHLAPPFGMQSMNVGMRESCRIADLLSEAIKAGKPTTQELRDFSAEQIAEWKQLLGLDIELRPTAETPEVVKANLPFILGCLPGSSDKLQDFVSQLNLEIHRRRVL